MDETKRQQFVKIIEDFTGMCGIYLPDDVDKRLRELAEEEKIDNARTMYECMLRDVSLAKELRRPICQDTGVIQYFVEVGTGFPYMDDIKDVLATAAANATMRTPLRPNVVEPLGEHNTGNNVGYGAPYIEYEIVPGSSDLRVRMYMAGGGCSLPGRSKVLMPLEGARS